jgi:hypothetical protein
MSKLSPDDLRANFAISFTGEEGYDAGFYFFHISSPTFLILSRRGFTPGVVSHLISRNVQSKLLSIHYIRWSLSLLSFLPFSSPSLSI